MTHQAIINADDLTQATTNTAQTIKLCDLAAGDVILKVALRVKVPFENTADAAFNTTTVSVGDNAAVTTFLAAAEANKNGTVVPNRIGTVSGGPYAAADKVAVTFNAMAAKALNSINKGELHVFFRLYRIPVLEQAAATGNIVTK